MTPFPLFLLVVLTFCVGFYAGWQLCYRATVKTLSLVAANIKKMPRD